jgi:hypothetical protein
MNSYKIGLPFLLGASLVFESSCVGSKPKKASGLPPATASAAPIPVESIEQVRRAEEVGRYIFVEDVIAAKGTDVAITDAGLLSDSRRRGWIVTRNADCAIVRFVGFEADQYLALFDVCFPWNSTTPEWKKSEVRRYNPALPLPADQENMVRARQLAIDSHKERCSDRYNTVMVPGHLIGNTGWAVYLLAATTEPWVIMYGGHVRVDVSEDGRKTLQITKLSKSCLRAKLSEKTTDGIQMVAGTVTEIVSDYPTEIHVYLSRLHNIPIYVSARSGMWKVEDGKIHWQGQKR